MEVKKSKMQKLKKSKIEEGVEVFLKFMQFKVFNQTEILLSF
jgi:hypothetical protein